MITMSSVVTATGAFAFCTAMLWAGIGDLLTMKIRNHTVLFLLASYAVLAPSTDLSFMQIASDVGVAVGVLALMFVFFSFGWIGGGDAKLASIIALWIGAEHTLLFVVYTGLFGGALTLAILSFRSMLPPVFCVGVPWIDRLHAKESGVPYGFAIATAALFTIPQTHWLTSLT